MTLRSPVLFLAHMALAVGLGVWLGIVYLNVRMCMSSFHPYARQKLTLG